MSRATSSTHDKRITVHVLDPSYTLTHFPPSLPPSLPPSSFSDENTDQLPKTVTPEWRALTAEYHKHNNAYVRGREGGKEGGEGG